MQVFQLVHQFSPFSRCSRRKSFQFCPRCEAASIFPDFAEDVYLSFAFLFIHSIHFPGDPERNRYYSHARNENNEIEYPGATVLFQIPFSSFSHFIPQTSPSAALIKPSTFGQSWESHNCIDMHWHPRPRHCSHQSDHSCCWSICKHSHCGDRSLAFATKPRYKSQHCFWFTMFSKYLEKMSAAQGKYVSLYTTVNSDHGKISHQDLVLSQCGYRDCLCKATHQQSLLSKRKTRSSWASRGACNHKAGVDAVA